MNKWADYCISHVRFNPEKTHIYQVKVLEDGSDRLLDIGIWTRTEVLNSLNDGKTFCTIIEGTNAWEMEAIVKKVTINNKDYIKTIKDSIEKDNLGNLPTF
jgi:hypothetical protein